MRGKKDRQGIGSACGKVILLGEHAVVYGHPAIAFPFPENVQVVIRQGTGKLRVETPGIAVPSKPNITRPSDLVEAALGGLRQKVDTSIVLNVPPMSGFGSSAALAVALLRAKADFMQRKMPGAQTLKAAIQIEKTAHGTPSGLDPAAVIAGKLIWFSKKTLSARPLSTGNRFWFVVTHADHHIGAREAIRSLKERRRDLPRLFSSLFCALGDAAKAGRRALTLGSPEQLGTTLNISHGVLRTLGVVGNDVEALVQAARGENALGAKMSGAGGGGGAMVALARSQANAKKIRKRLREMHRPVWIISL